MAHFQKSVLKVQTYHSPQGVVEVTPERLRHWAKETRRLREANYAIPIHFDHGEDEDELKPVAMEVFNRSVKKGRSASNTVGRLHDFIVAEDGQSATVTVEVLRKDAIEAAQTNAVYVSPVIFPEWKDGAGQVYQDVITSFDLVDHPVDYSQSTFTPVTTMSVIPVIRMGLQPYRLGLPMEDEEKDKDKESEGDKPVEMSTDEGSSEIEDSDDEALPEATDESGAADSLKLTDVLSSLGNMNIVLPMDTTAENFLDRLHTALLTAAAQQGLEADGNGLGADQQPEAATPSIATMSLAAQNAMKFAARQHSQSIQKNLETLLKTGRCTPAEAEERKRGLGVLKLSLDDKGNPRPSDIEKWIDSRKAVPKGTFWTPGQRSEYEAKRLSLVSQPAGREAKIDHQTNALSPEEIKQNVEKLTAHRKR